MKKVYAVVGAVGLFIGGLLTLWSDGPPARMSTDQAQGFYRTDTEAGRAFKKLVDTFAIKGQPFYVIPDKWDSNDLFSDVVNASYEDEAVSVLSSIPSIDIESSSSVKVKSIDGAFYCRIRLFGYRSGVPLKPSNLLTMYHEFGHCVDGYHGFESSGNYDEQGVIEFVNSMLWDNDGFTLTFDGKPRHSDDPHQVVDTWEREAYANVFALIYWDYLNQGKYTNLVATSLIESNAISCKKGMIQYINGPFVANANRMVQEQHARNIMMQGNRVVNLTRSVIQKTMSQFGYRDFIGSAVYVLAANGFIDRYELKDADFARSAAEKRNRLSKLE